MDLLTFLVGRSLRTLGRAAGGEVEQLVPRLPTSMSSETPPKAAAAADAVEARIPAGLRPLRYLGIPPSVLAWKPRLPSRNWSLFLITAGTLTYLYVDDRRQVRRIQEEYKERVASLGEQTIAPSAWPRKISVYACKPPGEENYDKGVLWFKRYMKVCIWIPLISLAFRPDDTPERENSRQDRAERWKDRRRLPVLTFFFPFFFFFSLAYFFLLGHFAIPSRSSFLPGWTMKS